MGGGVFGGAFVHASNALIGKTGSWILYIALIAAAFLVITGKTVRELAGSAGGKAKDITKTAQNGLSKLSGRYQSARRKRDPDVINSLNLPIGTELREDKRGASGNSGIIYHGYNEAPGKGAAPEPKPGEGALPETEKPGGKLQGKHRGQQGKERDDNDGFPPDIRAEKNGCTENEDKPRYVYRLPSLNLLQPASRANSQTQNKAITENVRILEKTLADFGVHAAVAQVNRGPSITRFELQPAAGVKVSKIVGLSDDIALALAAAHIRIEAPIPGKAAIGIEVPNTERTLVSLREILEDPVFRQPKSKLVFALGRDIAGAPIIADLATMPHLLIAGSTGSGKSVCINALIASILFSTTPDEVKMMMVDPKMVELSVYNDLPHLIHPVVTDPKKAAKALRWAVHEMERRYDTFAKTGVKDITRYNAWASQNQTGAEAPLMPQFIIIIDELADLMLVAPADVEDSICRLAQMARAAGMHLVVATQRPSVDVITGIIKANIPSRIAFAVSSQTDSRVILDMAGAEKLLGRGDMLYSTLEYPKPLRIQGVYVSDKEIENLTDFIKSANVLPAYLDEVLTESERDGGEEDEGLDALLPDAARIFIESGQASISLLQRRLRIGYTRAARIIDQMEEQGIVGGFEGSKARVIRMTMAQYDERFGKN